MKISSAMKRLLFYLFVGLIYFGLWLWSDLTKNPNEITARVFNNIWRAIYVTGLNFIFFEYILVYTTRRSAKWIYRILLTIAAFWVLMICYSFGLYFWRFIGIGLHAYTEITKYTSIQHGIASGTGYGIASFLFFAIARHLNSYIQLRQAAQQLRIEKQAAELNYLKSQTNPHFLFNTLNNIYSLSRDKSDLAPESILRLSAIMRFMLYETAGEFIAIEQELKIMADYIALERLRYDETLRVIFSQDVENMKQALPPLLLLPLVENAFKHGVSETRDQPFVNIHLSVNLRQLVFVVKNSTEAYTGEKVVKENIGLSNLRRQLQLLYTDYNLSVLQGDSVFTATLKINLGSHISL